jgi:hypothetical protein
LAYGVEDNQAEGIRENIIAGNRPENDLGTAILALRTSSLK